MLRRATRVAAVLALSACSVETTPFAASPVPDGGLFVSSLAPIDGTTFGGEAVTISGGGFDPSASVFFGTIEASSTQVTPPDLILATTPPSPAGTVAVMVQNPDGGTAAAPSSYTFHR